MAHKQMLCILGQFVYRRTSLHLGLLYSMLGIWSLEEIHNIITWKPLYSIIKETTGKVFGNSLSTCHEIVRIKRFLVLLKKLQGICGQQYMKERPTFTGLFHMSSPMFSAGHCYVPCLTFVTLLYWVWNTEFTVSSFPNDALHLCQNVRFTLDWYLKRTMRSSHVCFAKIFPMTVVQLFKAATSFPHLESIIWYLQG